jgi:GDP-L-fucose synthase
MSRPEKVYVAGHRGMVGSAIVRVLKRRGYEDVVTRTHAELDLADQARVRAFFEAERPRKVVLAAAKVGGIHANNTYPAEFIYQNLMIEANVIHESWRAGVKELLFLGSSCIYPRMAPQPMREDALLTGTLEATNEPYAIAKIAGIKLCESYNRQYGTDFRSVMPTNLYGPGDNYSPTGSHVLPALIRRYEEAREHGAPSVTNWGSGSPRREFLHVDDLADACLHLLDHYDDASQVNVGTGQDATIREIAGFVADAVGFEGETVWDTSKPDGTPRKLLDVTRLRDLGWTAHTPLREGIAATVDWFRGHADHLREVG